MKARFFTIALLLFGMCAMSFANKKSTYLISTIPVKFEISTNNSPSEQKVQKEEKAATKEVKQEEKIAKKEERNESEAILARQSKNKYYLAYLFKTKTFDETKISEFNKYFIYDEIKAYADRNKKNDLLAKSAGHDSFFEKFSK